MNENII